MYVSAILAVLWFATYSSYAMSYISIGGSDVSLFIVGDI
jgi:hypothetical protein